MAREYLDCCEAYPDGALPRIMCDHLLAILRADLEAKEHADLKRLCKDHKGAARSAAVLRTRVIDELERRDAAAAAATTAPPPTTRLAPLPVLLRLGRRKHLEVAQPKAPLLGSSMSTTCAARRQP